MNLIEVCDFVLLFKTKEKNESLQINISNENIVKEITDEKIELYFRI